MLVCLSQKNSSKWRQGNFKKSSHFLWSESADCKWNLALKEFYVVWNNRRQTPLSTISQHHQHRLPICTFVNILPCLQKNVLGFWRLGSIIQPAGVNKNRSKFLHDLRNRRCRKLSAITNLEKMKTILRWKIWSETLLTFVGRQTLPEILGICKHIWSCRLCLIEFHIKSFIRQISL